MKIVALISFLALLTMSGAVISDQMLTGSRQMAESGTN